MVKHIPSMIVRLKTLVICEFRPSSEKWTLLNVGA